MDSDLTDRVLHDYLKSISPNLLQQQHSRKCRTRTKLGPHEPGLYESAVHRELLDHEKQPQRSFQSEVQTLSSSCISLFSVKQTRVFAKSQSVPDGNDWASG